MGLSALTKRRRIARQLRYLLGEPAYDWILQFAGKRACIRDAVYCGVLPEEAKQMGVGQELPLEKCYAVLRARAHSILHL